jgi:hypothetical protein
MGRQQQVLTMVKKKKGKKVMMTMMTRTRNPFSFSRQTKNNNHPSERNTTPVRNKAKERVET